MKTKTIEIKYEDKKAKVVALKQKNQALKVKLEKVQEGEKVSLKDQIELLKQMLNSEKEHASHNKNLIDNFIDMQKLEIDSCKKPESIKLSGETTVADFITPTE